MVLNAKDDLEQCFKDADERQGLTGYDIARFGCLSNYKEALKKQVPTLNQIYDGYQRNYQTHDGSIINTNFAKLSKEDANFVTEIAEQQKIIGKSP